MSPKRLGVQVWVIATFILVLPSVSATLVSGSLTVASMDTMGPATTDGTFVGFVQQGQIGASTVPTGAFRLTADHIHMEVDESLVTVNSESGLYRGPVAPNTVPSEHENPFVEGQGARAPFELLIAASEGDAPSAKITSKCGALSPARVESVERPPRVHTEQERPPITMDTSSALEWKGCPFDATMTIAGDFVVALWEWDAILTDDTGQTVNIRTGAGESEYSPHQVTDSSLTKDRQAFLEVTNGVMEIPLESEVNHGLYIRDGEVDSGASVLLREASGDLRVGERSVRIAGEDVLLDGEMSFKVNRHKHDASLMIDVVGDARSAETDGEVLASIAESPGRPWMGWGVAGAAVVGALAAVLVVAAWIALRLASWWLVRTASSLDPSKTMDARRIHSKCTTALRAWSRNGPAYALRARAALTLRKPSSALLDQEQAHRFLRPVIDHEALLRNARDAAVNAVRLDRNESAVAWMHRVKALQDA